MTAPTGLWITYIIGMSGNPGTTVNLAIKARGPPTVEIKMARHRRPRCRPCYFLVVFHAGTEAVLGRNKNTSTSVHDPVEKRRHASIGKRHGGENISIVEAPRQHVTKCHRNYAAESTEEHHSIRPRDKIVHSSNKDDSRENGCRDCNGRPN